MFRRNYTRGSTARGGAAASSNNYDMVEEEVVETLSEDGAIDDLRTFRDEEIEEEFVEEEVLDERMQVLPGISEDEDEEVEVEVDDNYEDEYEEVEVTNYFSRSITSMTEVEVEDEVEFQQVTQRDDSQGLDETFFEEVMDDEEEYVDDTIRDDSEVDEVTLREDEEDLVLKEDFIRSCRIREVSATEARMKKEESKSPTKEYETSPEDSSENDDDSVSAEELTEAISYVLRQERAVQSFILTDEQAEKMAHLPVKVMKVVLDHLEVSDNDGTPIDWDFLLKIVLPFCDSEKAANNDNDDDDGSEAGENDGLCVGPCNCPRFCVNAAKRAEAATES
jgi:hypothetical protein